MVVVLADDLGEEVEAAGGGHHVGDLRHRRERLTDADEVALGADADHRLARNPTWRGSVTATICMTSASRRWTRWRTAASESPTALAMAA